MRKMIIGLGGPKGAGKSTVAKMIVDAVPGAELIPFAATLKAMMIAAGVPRECVYGDQKETPLDMLCGKSARYAMQTLGTEWGREIIGQDMWGRLWEKRVAESRAPLVVCDDVRFQNEALRINRLGGKVVCVFADQAQFDEKPEHPSEDFAALRYDVFLRSNHEAGIEALRDRVRTLLRCFKLDAEHA